MNSISTDAAENAIAVGVATAAGAAAIRRVALELSIPSDALNIRLVPPSQDFVDSLTTYAPSGLFGAGLRITRYADGFYYNCTLGFNTYRGTAFLTNSHCTNYRGQEYGTNVTAFYQPDASGAYIGYEANDPDYFNSQTSIDCPFVQARCRYSDAALFTYTSTTAPGAAGQGLIWKTTYASGSLGVNGSTEINGTLTIADEGDYAIQGQTLHKIGAATGWTYGAVTQTCADASAGGYWYLCQDYVSAQGDFGDSGAPVFENLGNGSVRLYGLLRGGVAGNYVQVSPLGAIWDEIGYVPAYYY